LWWLCGFCWSPSGPGLSSTLSHLLLLRLELIDAHVELLLLWQPNWIDMAEYFSDKFELWPIKIMKVGIIKRRAQWDLLLKYFRCELHKLELGVVPGFFFCLNIYF
jgi:hypothetical protein